MGNKNFRRELSVDVGSKKLAEWHEKPGAFGRINPPWETAKIIKKAKAIENNLEEHIQIQMGPFKKLWIARYHDVVKGEKFCDLQVQGPFAFWDHHHIFQADGENKARLIDQIEYREPMGKFGEILAGKMIAGKLERMFNYRHDITKLDLERHHADDKKLRSGKILLAGGSGLVGSALEPFLQTLGYEVYVLTRSAKKENHIAWNPDKGSIDSEKLNGFLAIINLAGRNIAAPWTKKVKRELRESRIKSTELLVNTILNLKEKPKVFISASGSSIYPLHDGKPYDENGIMGEGFLPKLAQEWEACSLPLEKVNVRRVVLRIGVVLSPAGGAMKKMLPAFQFGLGGPFGNGEQYMSWISLDDLLDIIAFSIEDERYSGVINTVSPQAVTNKEFSKTLAKVLKRPCFFKVPAFLYKMIPGGMGKEIFLASNRVVPQKLIDLGYKFRYENLERAFSHLLGYK